VVATLRAIASSSSSEREAFRRRATDYARRHDWATVAARSEYVYKTAVSGVKDGPIATPAKVVAQ
jgi:hypothetical protein